MHIAHISQTSQSMDIFIQLTLYHSLWRRNVRCMFDHFIAHQ